MIKVGLVLGLALAIGGWQYTVGIVLAALALAVARHAWKGAS